MEKFNLGRVTFDNVSFDEAVDAVLSLSRSKPGSYVVTPNVDHVVRAEDDELFCQILGGSDLSCVDGMPVLWASYLLATPVKAKVSGSDLVYGICARAAGTGHSIFLLGGLEGDAQLAAANLCRKYPGLKIAGCYYPPFGFENDPLENERIIAAIKSSGADIIFVGVGSPKQERWIDTQRHRFFDAPKGVFLGVGISIAFCAGTVQRAPLILQRTGLEWVYRIYKEPRRLFMRYMKDFYIVVIVLQTLYRKGRDGSKSSLT